MKSGGKLVEKLYRKEDGIMRAEKAVNGLYRSLSAEFVERI
jgi:hypothetical protein